MKIILYSIKGDIHAEAIKIFLDKHGLQYKEINVDNEETKRELKKLSLQDKISILKVIKSSCIEVFTGFDEYNLNLNLIEHIKKYNPKIET